MLRDLPDLHANSSGDFFEIRLPVSSHRNAAIWDRVRAPNQVKIETRHYINKMLATIQTLPSHGENRGSSPLGSASNSKALSR